MTLKPSRKGLILLTIIITAAATVWAISSSRSTVDFNTQVKPVINKKCISCHGGVKQQAGFSLLFRSEALAATESGKPAIIPGDPDNSELIRRIEATDPEERMPYKHEPLQPEQVKIFRQWIKEGAQWGDHWAYIPVTPVAPPTQKSSWFAADQPRWGLNDIDLFVYDRMQKENLMPSPQADKATLLRRLSLDLIGMPAPQAIASQFLNNDDAHAYEDLVDSLLASPHFGERWASLWMDIARYADTKGYESDYNRNIWKYRDWLIRAFNEDKPYDVFLTEQMAGDLLPNASDAQYLATAFHRNTLTNDEGGTDNEEFRTYAVLDRVNNTWEGILGSTFACVQCHAHPYDPFKHEEYYKFAAFFNNTRDEDTEMDYPLLREYEDADNLKLAQLKEWLQQHADKARANEIVGFLKTWQPTINSITSDEYENAALSSNWYAALRNHGSCRVKNVQLDNRNKLIYRYRTNASKGVLTIRLDRRDGEILKSVALKNTSSEWALAELDFGEVTGTHNLYFGFEHPEPFDPNRSGVYLDWFYFTNQFPGKGADGYEQALSSFWRLMNAKVTTTPILTENPSDLFRQTNVFERGNFLTKGEKVDPDVPHSLNPMPANAPRNRLGLAMWLTDKKNPLTSRTMVNRLWEQLFGRGIVETLEDMGTQGEAPINQDLLDHLSWEFMTTDQWSVKKLLKKMTMSAVYRQDSKTSDEMLEKDPYNKFLARGPRVRLSAEQIRDQALSLSGLLSDKMYGPSVMPWQPEGIWLFAYNGAQWKKSENEDQHRRGLYTYWKRTAPYPSMIAFDAPERMSCTPRRVNSNTPLQALVTLNDSVYLEAAQHFAYRMQALGGADPEQQISKGYALAMVKPISEPRLESLKKLYQTSLAEFKTDAHKTAEMTGAPDKIDKKKKAADNTTKRYDPETAALIVVANAMLNLNEVITKN